MRVYESTYVNAQPYDFSVGDARLTAQLDPLTGANRDFGAYINPGNGQPDENYDIFVSNANGVLNPNGNYITISGNCGVAAGCFNINAVSLLFGPIFETAEGGSEQFANTLTNAVYGRPGSYVPGSAANAVDGILETYTIMGDTIDFGEVLIEAVPNMSITVGFRSAIPEPATWAVMLLGFFGLGAAVRGQRRRLAVPA